MNLYEIDFISSCGGWYTYDIRALTVFDAVCELFHCTNNSTRISSISLKSDNHGVI